MYELLKIINNNCGSLSILGDTVFSVKQYTWHFWRSILYWFKSSYRNIVISNFSYFRPNVNR